MAVTTARVSLSTKGKRPGVKKPLFETRTGEDLHRATGSWNKLDRLIDREGDRYREVVTNPETGEVIHSCDEPLSKHKSHGSAKANPKKSDA
jgi:hypothetical protein